MQDLVKRLPDVANVIAEGVKKDPAMREALRDFEQACAKAEDERASLKDRETWAQIKEELAYELRRLALRMAHE